MGRPPAATTIINYHSKEGGGYVAWGWCSLRRPRTSWIEQNIWRAVQPNLWSRWQILKNLYSYLVSYFQVALSVSEVGMKEEYILHEPHQRDVVIKEEISEELTEDKVCCAWYFVSLFEMLILLNLQFHIFLWQKEIKCIFSCVYTHTYKHPCLLYTSRCV